MFISDKSIDIIIEKSDPADAWNSLQEIYQSGDQSQIILLNS